MKMTVMPQELERGDLILSWIDMETGDEVRVAANPAYGWEIENVIVRPEDAPAYRRHKHGTVQVLLDGGLSYFALPEDTQVLIDRLEK